VGVAAADDFAGEPTFMVDVEGRKVRGRLGVGIIGSSMCIE